VSRRQRLENGEVLVISVTPVPQGLVAPFVIFVLVEGFVIWLAMQWSLLHRYEGIALAALGVLPALVIATRTWRWRSHKITLTSQRVVIHGGVLARHSTQVNLGDVFATHADQSFAERLRRRGVVLLETSAGTVTLPPVRHPAALRRLVDRTRRDDASSKSPSWDEWFDDPRSGHRGPDSEE
jgi:membrane protein YdbS with pleckstrin-like domain